MSKKVNYFAALEDDDEERAKALFAPSILAAGGAGAVLPQPQHAVLGSAAIAGGSTYGASAGAGAAAAGAAGGSKAGTGPVDFSAVFAELEDAEKSVQPPSSSATWDFSAFGNVAQEQLQRSQQEAAAAQEAQKKLIEEHLAKLHASDHDRLKEKAAMASYSSKQNERRAAAKEKAEAVTERLSGKAQRKSQARKRLNQAKHVY